ncbi:hypothetical protein NXV73_24990 [Bacteroides salyersiae]|nr:hypothetical protein [Bacteroides salyersiae]
MLSLNLNEPELGWKEEVPFPGAARVQPVCAVQDGMLYLLGGFCPSQNGGEASVATDGYRYLPLQEQWEPVPAPAVAETGEPLTLTGGTSCVWSDSIILCTVEWIKIFFWMLSVVIISELQKKIICCNPLLGIGLMAG